MIVERKSEAHHGPVAFAVRRIILSSLLSALLLAGSVVVPFLPVGIAQASKTASERVFRVSGVIADITADNAVLAKEEALSAAKVEALGHLFARLSSPEQRKRLPKPTPALAESLMTEFQILSETMSPIRYRCEAAVGFDPNAVTKLFRARGVTAYNQPGPSVLIVPFFERDGVPLAFRASGEWYEALLNVPRNEMGLVPKKLAAGNFEDRMDPLQFIRRAERTSLDAFRLRYGTQGTIVATIQQSAGREGLTVSVKGSNGAGHISRDLGEFEDFGPAAAAVHAFLEDAWKNALDRGAVGYAGQPGGSITGSSATPMELRPSNGMLHPSGVRIWGG